MNAKKVGSFIKEQRQELGLSQKELAEKLYITDKAVSKWETGVSPTKGYLAASALPRSAAETAAASRTSSFQSP